MNSRILHRSCRREGALLTEAVVSLALLVLVMLPLAFAFMQETRSCRAAYFRAVALELVDGEMEALAAGEWRAFRSGRQTYPVLAAARTNLPPGEFALTLEGGRARLEWTPRKHGAGGPVVREITLR